MSFVPEMDGRVQNWHKGRKSWLKLGMSDQCIELLGQIDDVNTTRNRNDIRKQYVVALANV